MNGRRSAALLACGATVAIAIAGCGSSTEFVAPRPSALCVAVTVPLRGPQAQSGMLILAGIRRELARAHGRAGSYRVNLCGVSNDATAAGPSTTLAVQAALRASRRPDLIAYIGDSDSGAAAASAAVLTAAGISQVALGAPPPTNGAAVGTGGGAGVPAGRVAASAPTVSLLPTMGTQATAAATVLRRSGCTSLRTVSDGTPDGRLLNALVTGDFVAARTASVTFPCLFYAGPGTPSGVGVRVVLGAMNACPAVLTQPLVSLLPAATPGETGVREEPGGPPATRVCLLPAGMPVSAGPGQYGSVAMQIVLAAVEGLGGGGDDRAAVAGTLRATHLTASAIGPLLFASDGSREVRAYTLYGEPTGNAPRVVEIIPG